MHKRLIAMIEKLTDCIEPQFDNLESTLHVYDQNGNEITDQDKIISTGMSMKLIIFH